MAALSVSDLNLDVGSLQIGWIASGFLFGTLTVQAMIYNRKFAPKDSKTLKTLVFAVWLLEAGQLGCVTHAMHYITIAHSGDIFAIMKPPQTIGASFLLGSAVGPLVEAFYVGRLLRFSGKLSVALVGWVLALARFGGWVFLAVRVILASSLSSFVSQFGWLLSVLLSVSAVVDLVISAWIAYFLSRKRTRARTSTNKSARQLLDRVILWTLQTGVITSLSFLVVLVCYLVLQHYLVWMAVAAIVTKVSSNCFLASLNARSSTQFRHDASSGGRASRSRRTRTGSRNRQSVQHIATGNSIVGNIIGLYQIDSRSDEHELVEVDGEAASHTYGPSIQRSMSRASFSNTGADVYDRSAFSPDGTIVSFPSREARRGDGYWAI
uniref:DUF6534 domain-containing protein n=1 Tax=Mycena chlorophos TaxID=658473 RepID=A0ABQ0LRX3_MYCCL|nr:predicted protein [Mycena chlorophos]